ncbi:MAG: hypothetical protein AB8G17_00030 [Gammaproteobacteria bacterium]
MSSSAALRGMQPGYLLNQYPERKVTPVHPIASRWQRSMAGWGARRRHLEFARLSAQLSAAAKTMVQLNDAQRRRRFQSARQALRQEGWSRTNLIHGLSLVGAQVRELYGFDLHPEQLFGAWVMLHGSLAEMATGEGKTIVAGVCASVAAMSGVPVHIITSNDYLVERDAANMRALFAAVGLSSAHVSQSSDDDARRRAYASDVCYVSNKQLVFDYLRDRQSCGARPASVAARIGRLSGGSDQPPLLRGLCFAIVDEADSAFIDDAITPLILSQQGPASDDAAQAVTALSLARRLTIDRDYVVDRQTRRVRLARSGENYVGQLALGLNGKWRNRRFRIELVTQALAAQHVYSRDTDYLVRDEKIVLIDQATGRLMPDRKLQHGLHQIIEAKEQCELSGATRTIASLSFQNFFVRYKHLCGMTGTASEAVEELSKTYGLGVVRVPTHRPTQRKDLGSRFARDAHDYEQLIVASTRSHIARGRPVLIGTRSLAHSEKIAGFLRAAGIEHQVLNARQDADESQVVARAGQSAIVTIATNMAGRGTDIPISDSVRQVGGLHVVVSQLNDSSRIDRQLIGRCSRQGDPGSFEYIVAPNDPVLFPDADGPPVVSARRAALARSRFGRWLLFRQARRTQRKRERTQRLMREQVAKSDRHMRKKLSYTGYKE